MDIVLNLDKFMFDLIQGSGFVIIIILGVLKILAKHTKFSGDDKIIEMLLGMLRTIKKPKD